MDAHLHDMSRIETILAQVGCDPQPPARDLVSPVHLSTTYERAADGSYPGGYVYTRNANPTRRRFEDAMTLLEGGVDASAFASGMAATAAVFQSLRPGDHVIIPDDVYYGVRRLLRDSFEPWGLHVTTVDMTDLDALEHALLPETRIVWAETPSNPLSKITDLRAVANVVHDANSRLIVDSTWATPLLQRPLELGADYVMHSVTKYLSGHSDVLGGVVVTKYDDDWWTRVRAEQRSAGAVLDPFSAWLAMRGMRSLGARMALHARNARSVADFLYEHPRVTHVHYAGHPSHPGHDVAARQMDDFGGMLSFQVDGTAEDTLAVVGRTHVFARATSLGGTESLIEHRASIEEQPTATPDNLVRLSVGLEHVDDLIEDLDRALSG
ncbi:MAG: PLP-dependent aspartate aminotransferase family protein [Rhodothermales bacterium]